MSVFGPDYYHANFNDGAVPVARLKAAGMGFCILKVSQGTSYSWASSWFPQNAAAVRAAGIPLGGYHMLDGESGSGAEQAHYFLDHLSPQPGDVVPIMDFEASGRKSASISRYAAMAVEFIDTVHANGFECMIYGHADVKAAWSDWRSSGADYWWVPGDQPHNDIGPQGPDLWQYGPYTLPAGHPKNPGGLPREDMSVVLTALPLIGGGTDVTGDDIVAGWRYRQSHPDDPIPPKSPDGFEVGWHQRDLIEKAGKQGPPGPPGPPGKPYTPPKSEKVTITRG